MTDRQRLDLKLNVLVIMSVTEDTIGICITCLVILCRAWLSIMSVTYICLSTTDLLSMLSNILVRILSRMAVAIPF